MSIKLTNIDRMRTASKKRQNSSLVVERLAEPKEHCERIRPSVPKARQKLEKRGFCSCLKIIRIYRASAGPSALGVYMNRCPRVPLGAPPKATILSLLRSWADQDLSATLSANRMILTAKALVRSLSNI